MPYVLSDRHLMRPDGTHQRPIMRAPDEVVNLSWSPDGEWIAYAIYPREGQCSQLYLVPADGTGAKRLGHDYCSGDFAWSPDGSRIAFSKSAGGFSGGGISRMKVDGSDLRQLTHANRLPDFRPAWSPDGTRIAFTRDPAAFALADGRRRHEPAPAEDSIPVCVLRGELRAGLVARRPLDRPSLGYAAPMTRA